MERIIGRQPYSPEPWDDAKIRDAFIYDGGEAEYHDPINGAREQRRMAGGIFDRWLAAHDEAVRAEERERMSVDDLIDTTAGLALASAVWREGASTMLRSINEHDDGKPGHPNPWSKPVNPYSAPLLARIRAQGKEQDRG